MSIKRITGDGNCLFRSFADQVEGSQAEYGAYRQKTVEFMRQNADFFAPFVADQSFEEVRIDFIYIQYLDDMAEGISLFELYSQMEHGEEILNFKR